MSTNKNGLAPTAIGNQTKTENLRTGVSTINDTRTTPTLRYYRHTVAFRKNATSYHLCGHTRNTEEAQRIIASLGSHWATTPPCPDCAFITDMQRRSVELRQCDEPIAEEFQIANG